MIFVNGIHLRLLADNVEVLIWVFLPCWYLGVKHECWHTLVLLRLYCSATMLLLPRRSHCEAVSLVALTNINYLPRNLTCNILIYTLGHATTRYIQSRSSIIVMLRLAKHPIIATRGEISFFLIRDFIVNRYPRSWIGFPEVVTLVHSRRFTLQSTLLCKLVAHGPFVVQSELSLVKNARVLRPYTASEYQLEMTFW